jgi:cysteine desulfurase
MEPESPIYLDYNATSPTDPRVLEAMLPYFTDDFGNASSRTHSFGWAARDGVEKARAQAASLLGADPREIVFTSGATESNNLAVLGAAQKHGLELSRGRHIVTSTIEHKSVLDPCRRLEREGFQITYLTPHSSGEITVEQVADAVRSNTVLVALMWANNEIGVINDIPSIGRLCRERGIVLFTDGTQIVGRVQVNVEDASIDLMSWSAHKMYGPKGCGGLYVRRKRPRIRLVPLIEGGGHEGGVRSGTLNVPGIVGFGAACELAGKRIDDEIDRLTRLRDRLESSILEGLTDTVVLAAEAPRLPNTSCIRFGWVQSGSLLTELHPIAVSSGAACTTERAESSHVVAHFDFEDRIPSAAVRFSLGHGITEKQIDVVAQRVVESVTRLRNISPVHDLHQEGQSWPAIQAYVSGLARDYDSDGVDEKIVLPPSQSSLPPPLPLRSKFMSYFRSNRRTARFEEGAPAVTRILVGDADCGDVLRLDAHFVDGRIAESRFGAAGSAQVIALGGFIAEWLEGRTVEQARSASPALFADGLELFAGDEECCALGLAAIRRLAEKIVEAERSRSLSPS